MRGLVSKLSNELVEITLYKFIYYGNKEGCERFSDLIAFFKDFSYIIQCLKHDIFTKLSQIVKNRKQSIFLFETNVQTSLVQ